MARFECFCRNLILFERRTEVFELSELQEKKKKKTDRSRIRQKGGAPPFFCTGFEPLARVTLASTDSNSSGAFLANQLFLPFHCGFSFRQKTVQHASFRVQRGRGKARASDPKSLQERKIESDPCTTRSLESYPGECILMFDLQRRSMATTSSEALM